MKVEDFNLNPQFPTVLDSSMRSDYASCPRKFFYRHVLGLVTSGRNIHLTAGSAYAKAHEVFRKEYYSNDESDFCTCRAKAVLALIIEYGDPDFEPDEAKQWYNVVNAFLSYLDKYPPGFDYLKPYMQNGKPAVEFSFNLPIHEDIIHPETNDPLLFCGRFDMLGIMNDTLFVVDDKTTGRLGATWGRQWDLRSQFTGYCWGAQQFDYPVGGAIIRGTAILKTTINHAEAVVYRPDFMIERWWKKLLTESLAMTQRYSAAIANTDLDRCFPTHGEENNACTNYGECPYKILCETSTPEKWVEGSFEVDYWNPAEIR